MAATKKTNAPVSGKPKVANKPVKKVAPKKKSVAPKKKVVVTKVGKKKSAVVSQTKASPAKGAKKQAAKERDEEVVREAIESKPGGKDNILLRIALNYYESRKAAGLGHDFNFAKQSKSLSADTVADIKAKAQRVESASASLK